MDWNSSALWGIVGLIGGFIVSFIFYKISVKNKKLVYTITSQTLITDNLSKIDGLDITYQQKAINNLTSTTINIKSVGKDIIEMGDFGKATPLCIKTNGEFLLQDKIDSIITQNTNLNNLMKPIVKDGKTLLLNFDYLSQGDTITFVLLHTEKLEVDGKLKSGLLLDNTVLKKIDNVMDIILYICFAIVIFCVAIMYIFYSGVDGVFISIGNFLINLLIGMILIVYCKRIFGDFTNIKIDLKDSDISNIKF